MSFINSRLLIMGTIVIAKMLMAGTAMAETSTPTCGIRYAYTSQALPLPYPPLTTTSGPVLLSASESYGATGKLDCLNKINSYTSIESKCRSVAVRSGFSSGVKLTATVTFKSRTEQVERRISHLCSSPNISPSHCSIEIAGIGSSFAPAPQSTPECLTFCARASRLEPDRYAKCLSNGEVIREHNVQLLPPLPSLPVGIPLLCNYHFHGPNLQPSNELILVSEKSECISKVDAIARGLPNYFGGAAIVNGIVVKIYESVSF